MSPTAYTSGKLVCMSLFTCRHSSLSTWPQRWTHSSSRILLAVKHGMTAQMPTGINYEVVA